MKNSFRISGFSWKSKYIKRLNIDKFCIIRVGRFTNDSRDIQIINAQKKIYVENKDFLMLTRKATELNNNTDCMNPNFSGHFSAKGLKILGSLAGDSLGEYVRNYI